MAEEIKKNEILGKEASTDEETSTQPGADELLVNKVSWPELVGRTSEEAERSIKAEKPGFKVQIVPPNGFVTMDFRTDRVRIFLDEFGNVSRPPNVG